LEHIFELLQHRVLCHVLLGTHVTRKKVKKGNLIWNGVKGWSEAMTRSQCCSEHGFSHLGFSVTVQIEHLCIAYEYKCSVDIEQSSIDGRMAKINTVLV
jgi:hypothetical protein